MDNENAGNSEVFICVEITYNVSEDE